MTLKDMTPEEATQRLHKYVSSNDIDYARAAIDAGADVNAIGHKKRTPLHLAAEFGYTDVARLLIEQGVDLNARDYQQQTPLSSVRFLAGKKCDSDIVKLLEAAEKQSAQEQSNTPRADRIAQEREASGDKETHR